MSRDQRAERDHEGVPRAGQLLRGQLLADRYLVGEMIGEGGMAEVYRGRDQRLTRPVALKVLRPHLAHDPHLRQRFEEEARAAAHVTSPYVVSVYDAGEDDSKAFIVMELVTGETLHDLIARGPLAPAATRVVGAQVLAALEAAHAKGVLHRDIKPANILLTQEGMAKVSDFGIAKAVHPSPGTEDENTGNVILGTPSYLAPERARGEPASVASDLWSVGVLLYEALTGQRPFQGENAVAVSLAASQGSYEPVTALRPDVDPALAAVISRALAVEPTERYGSAAEMAAALEAPAGLADPTLGLPLGALAAGSERTDAITGTAPATAVLAGAGAGAVALGTTGVLAGTQFTPPPASRPRRSRRGTALLAGAGLALLLGAAAGAVLLLPGATGSGPSSTLLSRPARKGQHGVVTSRHHHRHRRRTQNHSNGSGVASTTVPVQAGTAATTPTTTRPHRSSAPARTTTTTRPPTTTTTTSPTTTTTTSNPAANGG